MALRLASLLLCFLLHAASGGGLPLPTSCSDTPTCDETFLAFPLGGGVSLGLWQPAHQPPLGTAFNVTQALVMVHGTDRNAAQYLCWALQAL